MLVTDTPNSEDSVVEEWVEMNNGCVCCTVKGSLIQTIDSLLEKRRASGKPPFDFVLLETTGLADPGPVAQELWVDDELLEEDSAVLDAVVTLVDASHVKKQLRDQKEVSLQIAHADTILLNKKDLVSEVELHEITEILRSMNGEAKIVSSERSRVDLSLILNQAAVTVKGRRGLRESPLGPVATEDVPRSVYASGSGFWAKGVEKYMPQNTGQLSSIHDANIRTVCLAVEGTVDVRSFESWLEDVLWERGGASDAEKDSVSPSGSVPLEVLRAKGVLFVDADDACDSVSRDGKQKRVVQAVRETYEITPGPPVEAGERLMNKIVLIGRGLVEEKLLPGLQKVIRRSER
jgi:G3E family GTPase